jgi:hypothetical protein
MINFLFLLLTEELGCVETLSLENDKKNSGIRHNPLI